MKNKKRPLILVTNDDGLFAPGIAALVKVAAMFGEVVVVAPDSPQSGQGHAITIEKPLRLNQVESLLPGVQTYECTGTPVDCVKLARHVLLKDNYPDLCLSGINHGSNASVNILYSGTMSAAMEASLEGIPSIGFSLCSYDHRADFTAATHYAQQLVAQVLEKGMGKTHLLNVNIPYIPLEEIKGFKLCRQAHGRWVEKFQEAFDPRGQKYYWLTGKFILDDEREDTDVQALNAGYISVVPSQSDLTDYQALESLKEIF